MLALMAVLIWAVSGLGPAAVTAASAAGVAPSVIGVRFGAYPEKTRFVIELTETVAFRVTTQADPYRVVIDFPELAWPPAAAPVKGAGLVQRYRNTVSSGGAMRVVLDLGEPARVREAFAIPSRDGRQPRFVLDLEPVDAAGFAREKDRVHGTLQTGAAPKARPALPTPQAQPTPHSLPTPQTKPRIVPAVAPGPTAPAAAKPHAQPAPRPAAPHRRVIAIDPGHGGNDPGAIAVGGIYEKEITLAMAREVKRQLEATGRYQVVLTRDRDIFLRLRERVARAREAQAELFVSLHADSIATPGIRGMSVYSLSDKASDREAETLAARENRADAIGGIDLSAENDDVATILIDLAQRDTMNHSRRFAALTVKELGRNIRLLPKPNRSAGFAVLTAADVPSVLIEMGYLSSAEDVGLLTRQDYRERFASSLTRTLDAYFNWLSGVRRS